MDRKHRSHVLAWRLTPETGAARADSAPRTISFTIPGAAGEAKDNWTPEDLLLGSLASCFTTTCSALAEHTKLEYTDLEVEVGGTVTEKAGSGAFTEIVVRARLTIPRREDPHRAQRMLQKAWANCLIARALSVEQTFDPVVTVAGTKAPAQALDGPHLGSYLSELAPNRPGQHSH